MVRVTHLVVGDPHFKEGNSEETDKMEKEIDRLIEEVKPDIVVILGDTIDRYNRVAVCRSEEWLIRLIQKVRVILLIGNHDRQDNTDYQSRVHPYLGISVSPSITVVDKTYREGDIVYVPYVPPGRFEEAVGDMAVGASLLYCHQSFIGSLDPLSADSTSSIKCRIISGHIHKRSMLRGDKNIPVSHEGRWDVYYPGAPLCNNFGDDWTRFCCSVVIEDGRVTVTEHEIQVPIRYTLTVSPGYDLETKELIEMADKYGRIHIKAPTLTDCNILQEDPIIRAAKRRGAQVHPFPQRLATVLVPRKTESFLDTLVANLRRELGDEADEVIDILRSDVRRH